MRNYASKSNKSMTRYRTPATWRARRAENIKRLKGSYSLTESVNYSGGR